MSADAPRHLDVSALPSDTYGTASPPWWGTLGFMLVEGTTLALCASAYIYVSRNYEGWPPLGTAAPDVLVPTLSVLLLLASLVPAHWLAKAAKRQDAAALRRIFAISVGVEVILVTVRALEFWSLNVRWDSNAYGSVVWFTIGIHTTLLLADLVETATFGAIFWLDRYEKKHFSDADDVAFYWYFVVLIWAPLYVMIYLSPFFA